MADARQHDFAKEMRNIVRDMENNNPDIVASVRMRKAWEKSVDDNVLSHTDAVYVVPDKDCSEVIIYIDSSIWVTELNLQAEMLRLKMNVALRGIYEDAGMARDTSGMSMVQAAAANERLKSLRFALSKSTYRKSAEPQSTAEQLSEQFAPELIEPISLTPEEDEQLRRSFEGIEDEAVRKAAYQAAKATAELNKGREASQR